MAEFPTLDTVQSFMEYTKLSRTRMYEIVHAKGFPCFRTAERGRIRIKREEALAWMEKYGQMDGAAS